FYQVLAVLNREEIIGRDIFNANVSHFAVEPMDFDQIDTVGTAGFPSRLLITMSMSPSLSISPKDAPRLTRGVIRASPVCAATSVSRRYCERAKYAARTLCRHRCCPPARKRGYSPAGRANRRCRNQRTPYPSPTALALLPRVKRTRPFTLTFAGH